MLRSRLTAYGCALVLSLFFAVPAHAAWSFSGYSIVIVTDTIGGGNTPVLAWNGDGGTDPVYTQGSNTIMDPDGNRIGLASYDVTVTGVWDYTGGGTVPDLDIVNYLDVEAVVDALNQGVAYAKISSGGVEDIMREAPSGGFKKRSGSLPEYLHYGTPAGPQVSFAHGVQTFAYNGDNEGDAAISTFLDP
jgi:hypothetical protein